MGWAVKQWKGFCEGLVKSLSSGFWEWVAILLLGQYTSSCPAKWGQNHKTGWKDSRRSVDLLRSEGHRDRNKQWKQIPKSRVSLLPAPRAAGALWASLYFWQKQKCRGLGQLEMCGWVGMRVLWNEIRVLPK